MSTMQNTNKPDIHGIETAATTPKYRQDAQIKGQRENSKYKIAPSIIHITIHTGQNLQDKICSEKKKSKRKFVPDSRVPCVKDVDRDSSTDTRDKESRVRKPDQYEKARRLIFPEMRGGVLYTKCCCLHRDGLQDYCPLSQCRGQPECLVKPWAVCPPGKFVRLRYPELYPKTSDTSCTI